MYKKNKICVVIPAYNEETQIGRVIENMPGFVDQITIVNDASSDTTATVVKKFQKHNTIPIILLEHSVNKGVGSALATGYKWAQAQQAFDCIVRMDGDDQMDPKEMTLLIDPVVEGLADYVKGNRLFTGEAFQRMPKIRYFGNAFLSLLTKIASGYWHVADFQSGYTAMNRKILDTINWDGMYTGYGQPNDLLVRLNVYNFKVADVPISPIYHIGEKSGIRIKKVIFTISWLLIKLFFWRMKEKYVIRDFHPLIFFYMLGFLFGTGTVGLAFRIIYYRFTIGYFPATSSLAMMFAFMSASLFTLFAMWFDMEANKDLKP